MPRIARASVGGVCYHVLNRGNGQRRVFHKDDYQAFLKAIRHASIEIPLPVFAYCLMPNHFHLFVRPNQDGDLSHWMHWVQNTHVRRDHQPYQSSGPIWQGRFKGFPIATDEHVLTVLRYVERNPVRAKLVRRAERWAWSSARYWQQTEGRPSFLEVGPVERPADWIDWVNQPLQEGELQAVRASVNRGRPYGGAEWIQKSAAAMGLRATLKPRGRPRKSGNEIGAE